MSSKMQGWCIWRAFPFAGLSCMKLLNPLHSKASIMYKGWSSTKGIPVSRPIVPLGGLKGNNYSTGWDLDSNWPSLKSRQPQRNLLPSGYLSNFSQAGAALKICHTILFLWLQTCSCLTTCFWAAPAKLWKLPVRISFQEYGSHVNTEGFTGSTLLQPGFCIQSQETYEED